MRTAMLLLALAVVADGAPGRTSPDKAARPSSPQADGRDRAPGDGVARGHGTDRRHPRLGDFNVPESTRAYA
ncbi:MAG TPA: hypothetical protein VFN91_12715 [Myxococcaceae bacterium]|nr:hypothetical protein [Myxococcaceae bacterium]